MCPWAIELIFLLVLLGVIFLHSYNYREEIILYKLKEAVVAHWLFYCKSECNYYETQFRQMHSSKVEKPQVFEEIVIKPASK